MSGKRASLINEQLDMAESNLTNPFSNAETDGIRQDVDVSNLRACIVRDMAELTSTITSVENRIREKLDTGADLEQLILKVDSRRIDLLTSITAWERLTLKNLDDETDLVSTRAMNAANKLISRLNEEIQLCVNYEINASGRPGVMKYNVGSQGENYGDVVPPVASEFDHKDSEAVRDTSVLRTRLLAEAAAVDVEKRYSTEYFQQRARSNAERAERLERRIAKRAEAERLRAEAERLQAETEVHLEEETRIREEEEKRKSEAEIEMKEESIKARMRILDEVEFTNTTYPPPSRGSQFYRGAYFDTRLATDVTGPRESLGRPRAGSMSPGVRARGQTRAKTDNSSTGNTNPFLDERGGANYIPSYESGLKSPPAPDSITELKSLYPTSQPVQMTPNPEPNLREAMYQQAQTIQRQQLELLSLREQVQELMQERQGRVVVTERKNLRFAHVDSNLGHEAGRDTTHSERNSPQKGGGDYSTPSRIPRRVAPIALTENDFNNLTPIDQITHPQTANTAPDGELVKILSEQLTLSRLPIVEPQVFSGRDPLYFPKWKIEFETLIHHRAIPTSERLHYLSKYLGGEAKEAIEGFLYMRSSNAYEKAYALLNHRYGDNFELASTFRQRLRAWPKISPTDTQGLRKFVDFLRQCQAAISSTNLHTLEVLNDEAENIEIIKRLPQWLSRAWARRVTAHRAATGSFPPFNDFVNFLIDEDDVANDPVSRAIQSSNSSSESRKVGNRAFATEMRENTPPACTYCRRAHSLHDCEAFRRQPYEERRRIVQENGLCYGCLLRGHLSRSCNGRKTCEICGRWHPTALHPERPEPGFRRLSENERGPARTSSNDSNPR